MSQEEEDNSSNQRKKANCMMKPKVRQKSIPSPIFERRVSERLKKDLGIRIEEKSRRMNVKRRLEVTIHKSKSNFSYLSSIKIIDISKKNGCYHE